MKGIINLRSVVFNGGFAVAVLVGLVVLVVTHLRWVGVVAFGVTGLLAFIIGISLRETE